MKEYPFKTYTSEAGIEWLIDFETPMIHEETKTGYLTGHPSQNDLKSLDDVLGTLESMCENDYLVDGALDRRTFESMRRDIRKQKRARSEN